VVCERCSDGVLAKDGVGSGGSVDRFRHFDSVKNHSEKDQKLEPALSFDQLRTPFFQT
jgi:hypothetical protein